MPDTWYAEADPLNHRRWYLMERGCRRFLCWWKDSASEQRGDVSALEDDGLRYRWDEDPIRRELMLVLSCGRCASRERFGQAFSRHSLEDGRYPLDRIEKDAQHRFRHAHTCLGKRRRQPRDQVAAEALGRALLAIMRWGETLPKKEMRAALADPLCPPGYAALAMIGAPDFWMVTRRLADEVHELAKAVFGRTADPDEVDATLAKWVDDGEIRLLCDVAELQVLAKKAYEQERVSE